MAVLKKTSGYLLAAVLLAAFLGCHKEEADKKPGAGLQFPVEVAPVVPRKVDYAISAVGQVEAFEQVLVNARVEGVVEKILFVEGDRVEKGAPLVEIEPERFRLQLAQSKAALEKVEAARAEAQAGYKRRVALNAQSTDPLLSEEDIEEWKTRARTAAAGVDEARAALDLAELDYKNCRAPAPAGGIIQTRDIKTGQYVKKETRLATLVQRDPLLLRFQVPVDEAGRLSAGAAARFTVRGTEKFFSARITHVSASAEAASRMVEVLAHVLEKNDPALRPGTFAEVSIPIGGNDRANVIPLTAIRPSERGFLAFVVEDGKARERVVSLGLRTADGFVEVRSGLAPGENVVVRGGEALRDGAGVSVKKAPASPAGGDAGPAGSPVQQ